MGKKLKKSNYAVDLKSSIITIAIVQLEGPLPNGKQASLVGDRNTLAWKSLEDVNARIEKACGILDSLSRLSRKPDVVVFPEYSLPVEKAVKQFEERARRYNQIIIGGADSMQQPDGRTIYNRCPIIMPKRKTVWVTKRELSKWEQGLVDEPSDCVLPTLTWKADGESYWLSVYICLDFMLAPFETKSGGGVFIVPMCSPDVDSFRGWGNAVLRLEGGAATVMCNCVGEGSAGQSGVVIVTPDGKPSKSAFELSASKEAVAVFDIDCKRLAPPRVTNPEFKYPLGTRYVYSLLGAPGGVELITTAEASDRPARRGVVNPAIYEFLGKTMRIAFLSVDNFWEIAQKLKDKDFEVAAILGQHDLMITHLHEKRYDMIYDINRIVRWKTMVGRYTSPDDEVSSDVYDSFPFFRVDVYFKVLGVAIEQADRSAFKGVNHQVPRLAEIIQIMKLGSDWDDEDVPRESREKFLERRWILKSTTIQPGEISSIMTIFLDHAGVDLEYRQLTFEDRVLPELVKKTAVTSVYRGRSQSLAIHYVLRLSAGLDSLYDIIEEAYRLASDARVSIITTTSVVVKKLSNLVLQKAVLMPMPPAEEANYRNAHLVPKLSEEDRVRLIYAQEEEQRTIVRLYQRIVESMRDVPRSVLPNEQVAELERKLAKGILHKDGMVLREPHDAIQLKVETALKSFIHKEVTEAQLANWRTDLNVQSGKKRDNLSFTERIKLATRFVEETGKLVGLIPLLHDLGRTTQMRNAFAHGNLEKIDLEEYSEVLASYCRFLSRWTP